MARQQSLGPVSQASSAAAPVAAPEVTGFFHEPTSSIAYLVADPSTGAAVIIDAVLDYDQASGRISAGFADAMLAEVQRRDLRIEWVLETHLHADHLTAGHYVRRRLGVPLGIGAQVVQVQQTLKQLYNAGDSFAADGSDFDHLFADGEALQLGSIAGEVLYTPGHTPACISYRFGDAVFHGDTLFMPDYGSARCDFPNGSARTLYRSIQRLLSLPDETRLFTGHDYRPGGRPAAWQSTVAAQRSGNKHIAGTDEEAFVQLREARDRELDAPGLIIPALQFNMRGGRLPPPEADGQVFLKIPIDLPLTAKARANPSPPLAEIRTP